ISRGVFHDRPARLEQTRLLRLVDNMDRHPILDRAARVHVLAFDQHGGVVGARQLSELDQWGMTDRRQNVLIEFHPRPPGRRIPWNSTPHFEIKLNRRSARKPTAPRSPSSRATRAAAPITGWAIFPTATC